MSVSSSQIFSQLIFAFLVLLLDFFKIFYIIFIVIIISVSHSPRDFSSSSPLRCLLFLKFSLRFIIQLNRFVLLPITMRVRIIFKIMFTLGLFLSQIIYNLVLTWRRSIWIALNVRNKLGFIDGTISKPLHNHLDCGSWSRCNDMVSTWFMNSVSKTIGQSLLFMSTAEAIWKNLLSHFKQDDAPWIYEIEQKICIQQGPLHVSSYYTELVILCEEYKNYVEIPVCTCGRCECNAALLWEQLQQCSRVTKLLMGLNEAFESTRRYILMIKPLKKSLAWWFKMKDKRQSNMLKWMHLSFRAMCLLMVSLSQLFLRIKYMLQHIQVIVLVNDLYVRIVVILVT